MVDNDLDGSVDFNTLLEWMETGDRDLQVQFKKNMFINKIIF